MGKKKKDKKGKGAEKTAQKTEKKAEKKVKKILKEKGEDDIEALIAEFQEKDRKLAAVTEEKCAPPSPRCNMSLSPHPDKDELIMFGGEYFNGKQTFMYNDLLFCNLKTQQWTKLIAPNAPPPRCSHQAVALKQAGGQLWIFGGEFASPSLSQFYHYKDLWCFHLKEKRWEKINAPGAPSSRSGHRMAVCKRQLIVFGGYHDNVMDYKYYNDVHAFNLDTFTWTKLTLSGLPPAPRSACQMAPLHDQRHLLVYGGYSKERQKKDVDTGKVHTDMFVLTPEGKNKEDTAPQKWKWMATKQSGVKPTPRCSFSMAVVPGNRAIIFGGVYDKEEDEEHVEGTFFNELFSLDMETGKWHELTLRGRREDKERKRRRKKKDPTGEGDQEVDEDEENGEEQMEEGMEKMQVSQAATDTPMVTSDDGVFTVTQGPQTTFDDGVFTVTVGAQGGETPSSGTTRTDRGDVPEEGQRGPCPRMNAALAVSHGVLYLYGGVYEEGDRQVTLSDMYALDLHKMDVWTTLIADDISTKEWIESESESGEDDDEEEGTEEGAVGGHRGQNDEESDMEEDSESEDEDEDEQPPVVRPGEQLTDYFSRSREVWMQLADNRAQQAGLQLPGKALKKQAFQMADDFYKQQS